MAKAGILGLAKSQQGWGESEGRCQTEKAHFLKLHLLYYYYKCPLPDADWTSDSKFCLIFQTEICSSLEPLDFKFF